MFVLIYIVVTFNHAGDHDLSILCTLQAINITLIIFMNYIPKNKEYISVVNLKRCHVSGKNTEKWL